MESFDRRLLRTPRPYEDENLKGLIIRAAEENAYETAAHLLSLAEVRVDERTGISIYTEQRLQNLSEMLNLDVPTLRDLACLTGIEGTPPEAYNIFGHRVYKYSVRTTKPKVCPDCLREANYARKIWDLAAFTCCPKHGVLLSDKCPECGNKISWNRPGVSICSHCGRDWREVAISEVPEGETTLSSLILETCGLRGAGEVPAGPEALGDPQMNPLSRVGLGELLSAVYFIAGQQNGVVDATGKQFACKLPHEDLHKVLVKAMPIFDDWPDNFHAFLEEIRGQVSKGSSQTGLPRDFGKLYDPLFVRKGNPLPEFIREAFNKYVVTRWDGGYAGWYSNISKGDVHLKRYMTKHETARFLHVGTHTVDVLHEKGYLRGPYFPWVNRSRRMIEADSVRELKEKWDKSITAARAGEKLGIGRRAVADLVRNGCLTAIQGPSATGQLAWKFEQPEIQRLLTLIDKKIAGSDKILTAHVSFHSAIKKLSKLSIEIAEFIQLILNGKITPIEKSEGAGLSSLLFDPAEIEQFSISESAKRRDDNHTMQEASRILRLSTEEVFFLINHGLLNAKKASIGRVAWEISREEIERFKSTYSTMGWLVEAMGTNTRGVVDRLMANGVMPLSGPKIDGGRIYLFKKADLETIDLAKVFPKAITNIQQINNRGLVSKRQLADIAGYTVAEIDGILREGWIFPKLVLRNVDEKGSRYFFSQEQVERFKELKAIKESQLALFDAERVAIRLKDISNVKPTFSKYKTERFKEQTDSRGCQLVLFKVKQAVLREAA